VDTSQFLVTIYRNSDGKAITCVVAQVDQLLATGKYRKEKEAPKAAPKAPVEAPKTPVEAPKNAPNRTVAAKPKETPSEVEKG